MSKMSELREKTAEDLKNAIVNWKKDLFGYRLSLSVHKLENTAVISKTKRNIAQAKTVLKEKEMGIEVKPKAVKKPAAKKAAPAKKAVAAKAEKPAAKKAAVVKKPATKKAAAKVAPAKKATAAKVATKRTGSKTK
jgi:ribosomal protein L29